MSEIQNVKNFLHSQKNLKRIFQKSFVKIKTPQNNTEFQKYLIKSRNANPSIIRKNDTPFSFNKNRITKSTFYSKLESNCSTKYDNNINNNKYTLTEMNQTYTNKIKNKNDSILLSSLFTLPDYKRKTINYFRRHENNSQLTNRNNNTFKFNDNRNISSIIYPKMGERKNSTLLLANSNADSQMSNLKSNSTCYNITNYNNFSSKSKIFQKSEKYYNLEFFLKDKFYSDILDKFNKQFEGKKFNHDKSVKDKIIELNQITDFWGGVFDYTIPIITTKRYQCITKSIDDRKKIREIYRKYNNCINEESKKYYYLSESKNKTKKIPKLFTTSSLIRKKKKEIKEKKLIEKMRRNKTEEQIKYLLNHYMYKIFK